MEIRALTSADVAAIASWRYPGRYSTYDFDEPSTLASDHCLAPDRTGRGLGHRFVDAILEFALERYQPERLRLYVLDWNERSEEVAARHGFAVESVLASDEGSFIVMVRQARD
jgi:RimJ/RimL family protein N-acetyltransferase